MKRFSAYSLINIYRKLNVEVLPKIWPQDFSIFNRISFDQYFLKILQKSLL